MYVTYVRFDILTTVTLKNAIFWDVRLCGTYKKVLEECITSIMKVTRISEVGKTLPVTSCVAVSKNSISEECIASIIRVTRISGL
jgi:hypothetical protein